MIWTQISMGQTVKHTRQVHGADAVWQVEARVLGPNLQCDGKRFLTKWYVGKCSEGASSAYYMLWYYQHTLKGTHFAWDQSSRCSWSLLGAEPVMNGCQQRVWQRPWGSQRPAARCLMVLTDLCWPVAKRPNIHQHWQARGTLPRMGTSQATATPAIMS